MSVKTKNLYEHLYETLEGVKSGQIDLQEAKAVVDISNAIVNVGKLELNIMKETNGDYELGIAPKIGANSWLQMKSDESIKVVSAEKKDELYDKMKEFTEKYKHRSPELITNKYNNETGMWEATYRLANNY